MFWPCMLGYLAFYEDSGYYYEGSSEGDTYAFGITTPKEPSVETWARLSVLVDGTSGFDRELFDRIDDIPKHLDDYLKDCDFGLDYHDIIWHSKRLRVDGLGRKLEDGFNGFDALEIMDLEGGVGPLTRVVQESNATIADGPFKINLPHKMSIYRFTNADTESDEVVRKMMSLLKLTRPAQ